MLPSFRKFFDSKAIKIIVDAFTAHQESAKNTYQACRVLKFLADKEDRGKAMVEKGAIPLLRTALTSDDEITVKLATNTLKELESLATASTVMDTA